MKLLVWLLLGLLVYWALRTQAKRNQAKRSRTKFEQDNLRNAAHTGNPTQPSPKPPAPIENMVACAYCQIYLPASEAIHLTTASSDCYFCSEEHAKLHSAAAKQPTE